MWQYVVKVLLTAAVVVAVSEIAKRRVGDLSQGIFWLVLPSLALFLVLPLLLRAGVSFWLSLGIACVVTAVAYFAMVWCLNRFGIRA